MRGAADFNRDQIWPEEKKRTNAERLSSEEKDKRTHSEGKRVPGRGVCQRRLERELKGMPRGHLSLGRKSLGRIPSVTKRKKEKTPLSAEEGAYWGHSCEKRSMNSRSSERRGNTHGKKYWKKRTWRLKETPSLPLRRVSAKAISIRTRVWGARFRNASVEGGSQASCRESIG